MSLHMKKNLQPSQAAGEDDNALKYVNNGHDTFEKLRVAELHPHGQTLT